MYRLVHNTHMNFGDYIRQQREAAGLSLRYVAGQIKVQPSYLSKVERNQQSPPSEAKIKALAAALGEHPDVLLAMAGKLSTDLADIIRQRPRLMAELLRELKDLPDNAVLRLVREVRDGDW